MTAEDLGERMQVIPEFILRKISEILDTYDKETTAAIVPMFGHYPKCGVTLPENHEGRQDIHRQADVQMQGLLATVHRRVWRLLILSPPESRSLE